MSAILSALELARLGPLEVAIRSRTMTSVELRESLANVRALRGEWDQRGMVSANRLPGAFDTILDAASALLAELDQRAPFLPSEAEEVE